jgi:mono/diheme cytochrome c family protein
MKSAIYISGILLLISFVVILQDDFNQEWKQSQREFAELDENRYHSGDNNGHAPSSEIRQIVVAGLNLIDRCPTCHLGIENDRYSLCEQPFTTHPGNILTSHETNEFGCTSCHFGQGYAVTYEKAAHEKLEFWNETMLPRELIQASCGTCHLSEEVPGADFLTGGRLLIKHKGCTGCHVINAFFEEETLGPDLQGIGNKVSRAWLYNWLKNPREYLAEARMPTYQLSNDEIKSLVEFLMSLDKEDSPPRPVKGKASEDGDEDAGQVLVGESRCITCHSIHDRGGKLAPELERVGDKVREDWLSNFLRNVHYYQPEKIMLSYNFTEQDALDIAAYMVEEYSDEEYELPEEAYDLDQPMPPSKRQAMIGEGEKVFAKKGCSGCHRIDGIDVLPKVGPKLTNIGNRLESTLDFGDYTEILPTLYNWIFMKIRQPMVFDSSSTMPHFNLSDREAFEITIALLGNKETGYATDYLVPETEASVYKKPGGEFGELFDRYSCISCHSVDKYGGTVSTVPLTIEGSTVQFDWLRDYLIRPYALRPILTERMPHFRMTEREASLMAEYITRVYVSDEIPRFFEFELKLADIAAGRQIVDSLQCVNCHIIGGKGGYLGPPLDNCGNRLQAGWVYSWMLHPGKYRPETIQPDFGLTEAEARGITAYLMTMKEDNK